MLAASDSPRPLDEVGVDAPERTPAPSEFTDDAAEKTFPATPGRRRLCTRECDGTARAARNAARRDRSDEVFAHSEQQGTAQRQAPGVTGACILLGGVRNRLVRERDVQPVRLE